MSLRPAWSVIIAASDSRAAVARTVASLRSQVTPDRFEIIVAAATDRIPPGEPISGVRWVAAEPGSGVPRLRQLGLQKAEAPIAVFTEDSCVVDPGWIAGWTESFADPATVGSTGPVEPAMGSAAIDWAVFFCEYAPFLPPRTARAAEPPQRLAGNNFAVRVAGLSELGHPEIQEWEIHGELSRIGAKLVEAPGALARHVRRYDWREAIGDRLRFGFEFGRLRARRHSRIINLGAVLAAPAILTVQLGRLAAIASTRRHRLRFLASLPVILGLLTAWSVGESLGWAWGAWVRAPVGNRCGRAARTPV